jgi:hypothetical protein
MSTYICLADVRPLSRDYNCTDSSAQGSSPYIQRVGFDNDHEIKNKLRKIYIEELKSLESYSLKFSFVIFVSFAHVEEIV